MVLFVYIYTHFTNGASRQCIVLMELHLLLVLSLERGNVIFEVVKDKIKARPTDTH